jgi:hypothetical protein
MAVRGNPFPADRRRRREREIQNRDELSRAPATADRDDLLGVIQIDALDSSGCPENLATQQPADLQSRTNCPRRSVHLIAHHRAVPEPDPLVSLEEQIDLIRRELEAQATKVREPLDPIERELDAELLLGQQSVNDDSNHSL